MIDLNDHYYFVKVAEHGGFASAGRALDLPKSTLSRRIIGLESRLGVRLIQRTSRSFALTEAGRDFQRHAQAMLIEAEAAESAIQQRLAEPRGTVRFTCSTGTAHLLTELLTRFLMRYPKVNLVQHATNRKVDLIEEGFDVGLRGHLRPLADSGLIVRRLSDTPWGLFAAPDYLARHPEPSTPDALRQHSGLAMGSGTDETRWELAATDGEIKSIRYQPRLRSDDHDTLKACAIAGLGIVALPRHLCSMEVRQGRLRHLLPDWTAHAGAALSLLVPTRRGQLPSVRAFTDFMVAEYPKTLRDA